MMADMRQLCLMLGIASCLSIGVFGFEKRCYRNNSDPAGVFTMVLRQNFNASAEQIMALDTTKAPTNCTSVSVGSPGVNELIIKFNIEAPLQTFPAENCYVEIASPVIKVYVVVQQDTGFIQASDLFYSATCNTSAVDTGFLELGPINITNNASFVPAPNRNTSVIMELVDENGDVTTTPILGQIVKIRTTYFFDQDALPSEFPRGLHNFALTVGPDSGSNWRIELINNAGCLPVPSNIFGVTETYAHNAAESAPGKNVFETGTFKVIMFATTKQLHFNGRYLAECYDQSEIKCFNQSAYCSNGRKRRAIDIEVNGTYSLSVNIGLPGQSTTQQNVGPTNDIKAQECVADKTYWILAVVLGIVLLIVTMVTMYIFCRLRSEQQRVEMINEKNGYANKAF